MFWPTRYPKHLASRHQPASRIPRISHPVGAHAEDAEPAADPPSEAVPAVAEIEVVEQPPNETLMNRPRPSRRIDKLSLALFLGFWVAAGLVALYLLVVVPNQNAASNADIGKKTVLIFFEWDRADLTARSRAIVADAARYGGSVTYAHIDVDGHNDTSQPEDYSVAISERRARTVAAELVRDGIPQNAIVMHAYGSTKPMVPTGPGVREPQNRRVEIVFQ